MHYRRVTHYVGHCRRSLVPLKRCETWWRRVGFEIGQAKQNNCTIYIYIYKPLRGHDDVVGDDDRLCDDVFLAHTKSHTKYTWRGVSQLLHICNCQTHNREWVQVCICICIEWVSKRERESDISHANICEWIKWGAHEALVGLDFARRRRAKCLPYAQSARYMCVLLAIFAVVVRSDRLSHDNEIECCKRALDKRTYMYILIHFWH